MRTSFTLSSGAVTNVLMSPFIHVFFINPVSVYNLWVEFFNALLPTKPLYQFLLGPYIVLCQNLAFWNLLVPHVWNFAVRVV